MWHQDRGHQLVAATERQAATAAETCRNTSRKGKETRETRILSKYKMGVVATPRTLNFGDHSVELKLVYDVNPKYSEIDEVVEDHGNYEIELQACWNLHLLESTSNNEVLLILQRQDIFSSIDNSNVENGGNNMEEEENGGGGNNVEEEENGGGGNNVEEEENDEGYDGGDNFEGEGGDGEFHINMLDEDDRFTYMRTSGFEIYRIDPHNEKINLVPSLGDEVLFLSNGGSLSLRPSDIQSKDVGGNCIYFATNNVHHEFPFLRNIYQSGDWRL
ncbi:hypothetical protein ACLB2K_038600 [Fragaria x ananassa]